MAAFLRASTERLAATLRARGADVPPGAIEQFARVAYEHLVAHPRDKTFYDISASRLVAMVHGLEKELPGGRGDPKFSERLATKFREALKGQG